MKKKKYFAHDEIFEEILYHNRYKAQQRKKSFLKEKYATVQNVYQCGIKMSIYVQSELCMKSLLRALLTLWKKNPW